MRVILPVFFLFFLYSCKPTSYFVVRHAEKETNTTMASDVPLSVQGKERAEALKDLLLSAHIRSIYSTNFLRTRATAEPLARVLKIEIQSYQPADTGFIRSLRSKNENILIVGHSNTVDNIVNTLMGSVVIPADLTDTQYGDLFVIKRKGKHYRLDRRRFGK